MNTLSPKLQYLLVHKEDAERLSTIITGERTLSVSCLYALAEMAHNGATREELNGADKFITTLLNIGEPDKTPTPLPKKELKDVQQELERLNKVDKEKK